MRVNPPNSQLTAVVEQDYGAQTMKNRKQLIPIMAVIAIGIVLGGLILTLDKTPQSTPAGPEAGPEDEALVARDKPEVSGVSGVRRDDAENQYRKGPKGGKLFATDGFGLEVTIFETGVPPQFRLYPYENGKPVPPSAVEVTLTLSRLGAPAEVYQFKPEADYLIGDQIVGEPHSFDVV